MTKPLKVRKWRQTDGYPYHICTLVYQQPIGTGPKGREEVVEEHNALVDAYNKLLAAKNAHQQ